MFEEEIIKLWGFLETQKDLIEKKTVYSPMLQEDMRFQKIHCPLNTAVHIDADFLHASHVQINTVHYIASQAPLPHTTELFWKACIEYAPFIVDLTGFKDGVVKYYPDQEGMQLEYGKVLVKCLKEIKLDSQEEFEFCFPSKLTSCKRYQDFRWPDHFCLNPQQLLEAVELIDRLRNNSILWVHCLAGVGRTGTFITAHALWKQHQLGLLSSKNWKEELLKVILTGREARSIYFVETLFQFTTLVKFVKNLIK